MGRNRNPNSNTVNRHNNNLESSYDSQGGKMTIYKTPGRYAPDRLRVRLIYQDPTGSRTTTGSSLSSNWRYRSSAFDPDPLLLTGSIPGYAELANLYSQYRVHAMHLNLDVANQDTQAYIVVCWPGTFNINNNSLSASDLAEFSGNVLGVSKMVGGASGMNVAKLKTSAFGQQLVGPQFRTDMDWASSTSTNPLKEFYINVGAYSPLGNQAYPLVVQARIIYDIEFFVLRQLES